MVYQNSANTQYRERYSLFSWSGRSYSVDNAAKLSVFTEVKCKDSVNVYKISHNAKLDLVALRNEQRKLDTRVGH